MTPTAYLSELEQRLACIPAEDRTEIIQFYQEFLEDGGEAAMAELGTPDVLAQRILQENGYTAGAPEAPQGSKKKSKSHTVAIWVLLILSSPIWLSLVISFLSIIFSLLVTLVFVQPGSFCIGMRWIWHCHAVPLYSGWHFQHRCRNRLRRNHRFAVQALLDCHESNLPVLRTCPALVWKSLLWKGVVSI